MSANRGAVDVIMPALRHGLGERDGDALPDTGDAPSSEPPIDRIPVAILLRNVVPWRAGAWAPQKAVYDVAILLGGRPRPRLPGLAQPATILAKYADRPLSDRRGSRLLLNLALNKTKLTLNDFVDAT